MKLPSSTFGQDQAQHLRFSENPHHTSNVWSRSSSMSSINKKSRKLDSSDGANACPASACTLSRSKSSTLQILVLFHGWGSIEVEAASESSVIEESASEINSTYDGTVGTGCVTLDLDRINAFACCWFPISSDKARWKDSASWKPSSKATCCDTVHIGDRRLGRSLGIKKQSSFVKGLTTLAETALA